MHKIKKNRGRNVRYFEKLCWLIMKIFVFAICGLLAHLRDLQNCDSGINPRICDFVLCGLWQKQCACPISDKVTRYAPLLPYLLVFNLFGPIPYSNVLSFFAVNIEQEFKYRSFVFSLNPKMSVKLNFLLALCNVLKQICVISTVGPVNKQWKQYIMVHRQRCIDNIMRIHLLQEARAFFLSSYTSSPFQAARVWAVPATQRNKD